MHNNFLSLVLKKKKVSVAKLIKQSNIICLVTKRFSIWTPCLIMFDCVEQNLIKHHEKFCLYKQVLCSLATQYNINMLDYQTLPIKTELNLILKLPATTWLKIRNTKLVCFYVSSFHSEFIGLIVLCKNKRNEMKNLYFAK